ncbi:MAG: hypothetical protein LBR50_09175, partial [Tannerella sp.]|nr:hypothetical protein [Tannerella sp.]
MRTNLQKVQLALTIILHLAGWGLFIYLTMPHFNRMARMPAEDFFWFPALSYLFLAIYFYANSSVFVPRYLSKRKVALYLLITAAAYLFFCVALSWVLRELFLSDNAAFSDFQPGQGMPPDRSNFPPFEGDSMAMPPRRGMGMPPGQSGFPPPFRDSTAMMPPRRFDSPPFDPATNQWSYLVARLGLYARSSQFLVVFIVSTGLKVVSQWYAEQRRLQELENSMVQA